MTRREPDSREQESADGVVFVSYAHDDRQLISTFDNHLRAATPQVHLAPWTDDQIEAGTRWDEAIQRALDDTQVLIAMLSASFLNSAGCLAELGYARSKKARVLPVVVKPVSQVVVDRHFPRTELLPLDSQKRPRDVQSWKPRDRAWVQVVDALLRIQGRPSSSNEAEGCTPSIALKDVLLGLDASGVLSEDVLLSVARVLGGAQLVDRLAERTRSGQRIDSVLVIEELVQTLASLNPLAVPRTFKDCLERVLEDIRLLEWPARRMAEGRFWRTVWTQAREVIGAGPSKLTAPDPDHLELYDGPTGLALTLTRAGTALRLREEGVAPIYPIAAPRFAAPSVGAWPHDSASELAQGLASVLVAPHEVRVRADGSRAALSSLARPWHRAPSLIGTHTAGAPPRNVVRYVAGSRPCGAPAGPVVSVVRSERLEGWRDHSMMVDASEALAHQIQPSLETPLCLAVEVERADGHGARPLARTRDALAPLDEWLVAEGLLAGGEPGTPEAMLTDSPSSDSQPAYVLWLLACEERWVGLLREAVELSQYLGAVVVSDAGDRRACETLAGLLVHHHPHDACAMFAHLHPGEPHRWPECFGAPALRPEGRTP